MSAVVIMGPSGCGKTTLGKDLARHLGWRFVEGDDLHPRANIEKMSSGMALDDYDRQPFLHNVGKALAKHEPEGVVAACSALKKSYRDLIRDYVPGVLFILPPSSRDVLLENMAARGDHFMPTSLLDSQLADLELPDDNENILLLANGVTTEAALQEVRRFLPDQGGGVNPSAS